MGSIRKFSLYYLYQQGLALTNLYFDESAFGNTN